ncbi:MAG: bacillithiol biosynthesis deacetylase BshB1 [Acidobacteriota bacterium]
MSATARDPRALIRVLRGGATLDDLAPVDALAIGAHPDDIELGCGGTVATLVAQGRTVAFVHLTHGEAGTRGTPTQRDDEARQAAAALGVETVVQLDCGDGALRKDEIEIDALIAVVRRLHPELVLGPPPIDRHPDHRRAYHLVDDAMFYAGLRKRAPGLGGDAHRPALVVSYMQHDAFDPSFIVDVTDAWPRKMAALDAYESQIHPGDGGHGATGDDPPTKISSPSFRASVVGRAQHFGQMIGVDYGEPFWRRTPLAIRDPFVLVPRGLR